MDWFKFEALEGSHRLTIKGIIGNGAINPKDLKKALKDKGGIDLYIDSDGGNVKEGMELFKIIKAHKGVVTAYVENIVASMATIIASAADEVLISPSHYYMVHNPTIKTAKSVSLSLTDLKNTQKMVEEVTAMMIDIYHEKTGLARKKIARLMDDETYMTGDIAVKYGFADRLLGEHPIVACLEQNVYKNAPKELLIMTEKEKELAADIVALKTSSDAEITALKTGKTDLEAELLAAKDALKAVKFSTRESEIVALATATKVEFSKEDTEQYHAMTDEMFATVSKSMSAIKPAAPDNLFEAQATGGGNGGKETSMADRVDEIYKGDK